MKVTWTPEAEQDRLEIIEYLAAYDAAAAQKINRMFDKAAERLGRFPHSAREGQLAGTRELIPHPSYRRVYEIRADSIWIAAPFHTARQWPPITEDDD